MAQFSNLSLTAKGLALQVKAQTGAQLNFTKVQFGDGSLATGETVANLTALKSPKMTASIVSNTVIGDGTSQIRTILNNSNLATGFYLREVGVFAQDPDEGEILYEYAMAGEYADYVPAGTGNSVFESTLDLIAIIGNASNVTATIQSGAYTSQLDFEERNAESTGYGVISGGEITAQPTPNMSVNASAINADLPSGKKATQNQNTVLIDASDSTKPRTDIVYVKSDGTIGYLKSGLGTGAVAGKEIYTIGTNAVGAIAGSKNYTINTNAVGVVAGSNTYTIDTNFVANDTVEFDGITFTAVSSSATGNQFNVGASTTESATNLASVLNANSTINALYSVSASNNVITITEKTAGGGNTPGNMTTTGTSVITAGTATSSKASDTVVFDGITFAAISSGATGNQFNIGADTTATATNLVSVINNNTTINATYTATSSNNVITVTEKIAGSNNTPGNMSVNGTIAITNGAATTSKSADTVTINGIIFTAVESNATGNQFNIGTDTTSTATNLASALNSNSTISTLYTATSSTNVITLTEKVAGGGHTPTTSSTTGAIAITNGTVINSTVQIYPSAPTTPDGGFLLGQIAVGAGVTSIVQSNIADKRVFKLNNNQLAQQNVQLSAEMADIPNQTYITEKAKQADLNTANENINENTNNINTQKSRIDTLVQTSSSSYYEKCASGDTGALLIVSSGATTGQINLADVTPVADGYTPIAGDYVRLVYGVAGGSSELIDARVDNQGSTFSTVNGHLGNIENAIKTGKAKYRFGSWEQGGIVNGSDNNDPANLPIRIRTAPLNLPDVITLDGDGNFSINVADGYSVAFSFYSDSACTNFISDTFWLTGSCAVKKISNYIRIAIKENTGANVNATQGTDLLYADYDYNAIDSIARAETNSLNRKNTYNLTSISNITALLKSINIMPYSFEQGGISINNNIVTLNNGVIGSNIRLRAYSSNLGYPVTITAKTGYSIGFTTVKSDGTLVKDSGWTTKWDIVANSSDYDGYYIGVKANDNSNIYKENITDYITVTIENNIFDEIRGVNESNDYTSFYGERISPYKKIANTKKIMDYTEGSNSTQGLAIYGDYLVRAEHYGELYIYSIKTGELLGDIKTKIGAHCNSIMFGSALYNDTFPLLYIGDQTNNELWVLSITLNSFEVVRKYKFPTTTGYYIDTVVNEPAQLIYTIGYKNNSYTDANDNNMIVTAFSLSQYSTENDYVIPTQFDSFTVPFISTCQGATFYNGKILIASMQGHQYNSDKVVFAIDIANQNISTEIRIPSSWGNEVEGIDVYYDTDEQKYCLFVTLRDTIFAIYRIDF